MKKIAIFGGTFNPIHIGHTQNLLSVKREFALDRVYLIPSKIPVHKAVPYDPGVEERFAMVELAIRDFEELRALRNEIDRESPSYSVITVKEILDAQPNVKLYFILGSDSFNTVLGWKNYSELSRLVHFIVLSRPGDLLKRSLLDIVPSVSVAQNRDIDISSTELRSMLARGQDCSQMLDDAVYTYIQEKGFYRQ